MAGDLDAVKKGMSPYSAPVDINLPIEETKKEILIQERKTETKESSGLSVPLSKDYKAEAIKPTRAETKWIAPATDYRSEDSETARLETEEIKAPIRFGFPKIFPKKAEGKSGFFGLFKDKNEVKISPDEVPKIKTQIPLRSDIKPSSEPFIPSKPITPPKIQPFSSPISKPIISQPKMESQQQTTYAPPLNIPTIPPAPNLPFRPLTPPPPPWPPMPTTQAVPKAQKPAAIPPIRGFPPAQQIGIPQSEFSKPKKGKLIAIVVVSVFILTFIAGEIWWFFLKGETARTETQSNSGILPPPQNVEPLLPEGSSAATEIIVEEQNIPSAVLSYEKFETIDLVDLPDVGGFADTDELVRLVVKFSAEQTEQTGGDEVGASGSKNMEGNRNADIASAAKKLKIKIPASVSVLFLEDFDLFVFGGGSGDREKCVSARITSESCYGPRLGMAVKVSDSQKALSALKIWEKTMVSDLKPMILAKAGSQASSAFLTGTYKGQTIRYKNMPINTTTVEYVLADDILIITTSKSSILKAIDNLPVADETNSVEAE